MVEGKDSWSFDYSGLYVFDMKHKFTKEEFLSVIHKSESMGHLLELLGIIKAGGNYSTMKRRIMMWKIDVSHWNKTRKKRQKHFSGKTGGNPPLSLDKILVKNSTYNQSFKLKNRLIKEGIFERKCYGCQGTEWLNKPMPVELEHKNGDKFDNQITNLTLLCPNCHSFTPTYRGKNKKVVAVEGFEPTEDRTF